MADVDKLATSFCQLLQMLGVEVNNDVRNALIDLLPDLRGRVAAEVKAFYRTVLIPKVSACIPSTSGISLKKQLKPLKKPLLSIFKNFAKKGEIPTLDDMKNLGKQALSCLIVEAIGDRAGLGEEKKSSLQATCKYLLDVAEKTGFSKGDIMKIVPFGIIQHLLPNAPENVREKIVQALKQGRGMLFRSAEKRPSMESFFRSLWELSGERFLVDGFKEKAEEIVARMPNVADIVNEFVMKHIACLLSRYCKGRECDILVPFICLSIENIVKRGTIRGKEFIGRGVEILYQSLRKVLDKQNKEEISKIAESIYELLKMFCKEIKEDLKKELIASFDNLRGLAANELSSFYSTVIIPKLSAYINAASGISVEKMLQALDKPVTSILENFVKKGQIPSSNVLRRLGKQALPDFIVNIIGSGIWLSDEVRNILKVTCNYMLAVGETAGFSISDIMTIIPICIIKYLLPNAQENFKQKIVQSLKTVKQILFSCAGKKPSIEEFFKGLLELSGGRFFVDGFKAKADEIVEKMPDSVDKVAEFVMKNVMPLLTIYCKESVIGVLWPFTRLSIDIIKEKGTIRGRDFYGPGLEIIGRSLAACLKNTPVANTTTGTAVKTFHKEVTEMVVERITEKVVVKKVGEVVTAEASKKVTASASKRMVEKFTEHAVSNNGVKEIIKKSSSKATENITINTAKKATCQFAKKQIAKNPSQQIMMKVSAKTTNKMARQVGNKSIKVATKVTQGAEETVIFVTKSSNKALATASKEVTTKNSIKVVGDVTKVTTKKTTVNVVKTTRQEIVQQTTKNAAKVGAKTALKECCKAAAIAAVFGGVFLYKDLQELEKHYREGKITKEEYEKQKAGRYGEFAGDIIGSGVAGTVTAVAALTGPAGWLMIGAGALSSYGLGCLGRQIAYSVS